MKTPLKKAPTKKTALKKLSKPSSKKVIENDILKEEVKYDPSKSYTWSKESNFVLTGEEFIILFNFIQAFKSFIPTLAHCSNNVENILEKGLKEGFVKEVEVTT
jgi:hypothetical protein